MLLLVFVFLFLVLGSWLFGLVCGIVLCSFSCSQFVVRVLVIVPAVVILRCYYSSFMFFVLAIVLVTGYCVVSCSLLVLGFFFFVTGICSLVL